MEHERRPVASIDPASGEVWRRWTPSNGEDIAASVRRARVAQPAWAQRPLGDRGGILERFRRLLFEHRAAMASLIEREAGKSAAEAMMADVITTLDVARYCERRASHVLSTRTIVPANIAL